MVAFRLPIVMIVCVSTLCAAERRSHAGVIEVAVAAAKSPPAKWFAGFATTYLVQKGADWAWDQITGKPKVDELTREIVAMEAKYPAYRVYFEALRANINSNTDQLTFERSIAAIVRKIDEDAVAENRLKSKQTTGLGAAPAPPITANPPFSGVSAADYGLTGLRLGTFNAPLARARLVPPSDSATGLLHKSASFSLLKPIDLPDGNGFKAALTNPPMTLRGLDALATPWKPVELPHGLGATAAPANLGASPSPSELSIQPTSPLYPSSGEVTASGPVYPVHFPLSTTPPVTPWRDLRYAPPSIGQEVVPPLATPRPVEYPVSAPRVPSP